MHIYINILQCVHTDIHVHVSNDTSPTIAGTIHLLVDWCFFRPPIYRHRQIYMNMYTYSMSIYVHVYTC